MSWNLFAQSLPTVMQAVEDARNEDAVIVTDITKSRTRTAAELSSLIKVHGGGLVVPDAYDSNYIVAVNNGLRFSITRLANGQFRITESMNWLLLLGVAGIVGVVLLSRR